VHSFFDYYEVGKRIGIKSVLSSFVSHSDFWYSDKARKKLKSVEEINAADRQIIADAFVQNRTDNGRKNIHEYRRPIRAVSIAEINQHIVEYIDFVIPRHYFVLLKEQERQKTIDRSEYRKWYNNICQVPGIQFFYPDNYQRELVSVKLKEEAIFRNKQINFYAGFSDEDLYTMLENDVKNGGFVLKKTLGCLTRTELMELLDYFRKDNSIKNLFDYVEYE